MANFLALAGALLLIEYACAANPPGQETGYINFYFDHNIDYFVAATSSTCFLVQLTSAERDHIHTNQGMQDIELTMMRQWVGVLPETKIYHNDPNLPTPVAQWCNRKDMFLLERNIGVLTTHRSPLQSIAPGR